MRKRTNTMRKVTKGCSLVIFTVLVTVAAGVMANVNLIFGYLANNGSSPATRPALASLSGHAPLILRIAFSPNGKLLASSGDNIVKLGEIHT